MSDRDRAGGEDALDLAAAALRAHTEDGWVLARPGLLERVRRAFRPSAPVLGTHELGDFRVAADVVVDGLRTAVDALPDAAADRISCSTGGDDRLESVLVEVAVAFGTPLPALAGRVRRVVVARLRELLGEAAPAEEAVQVDVHVGDVVRTLREVR
ncbi:hypothetical protein GTQ99_07595 [Kineococcus sp. T13]|uniref:hypothetical protein n=1 Tax=Kineococcus vitellinus TaxID=2696565 RepID=UPI00141213AD|nr:hypothetical protein [Kineococcus vitellinus]NAZ75287.1 hypothetical protein [Kineococcus vitellinus]